MKGTIGVVGLGIMGGAMSRNLAAAGWNVVGFDVSAARRAEAEADGVAPAADVADLARRAPLILTSLPSAAAAAATATAVAASGAPPGRVVADASTLALEDKLAFARVLSAAGHRALDCPVSGTGAQAKVKDLVVYASGDAAAVAEMMPAFGDLAREAHDLGAFGNGTRMKLVANLLVAIHNVASAEAMVLGMRAGLDPHQIVKLVGAGVGNSRVFALRAPMMAEDRYEPATMKVSTWQKDMDVIGRFAAELGVDAPLFRASAPVYDDALARGFADLDTAAVCRVLEARAGMGRPAEGGAAITQSDRAGANI